MFHVKHDGWSDAGAPEGPSALEPAQIIALEAYGSLLEERGADLGLISASDVPRVRERHVEDALRAVPLLPREAVSALDLGSGGGLPGVPLAIARPLMEVVLAESRRRRAAFLEFVVDTLQLQNVVVHTGRVEDLTGPFDVCLARAFANASASWEAAERVLGPGGYLLYWAGTTFKVSDVPRDVEADVRPPSTLANAGPIVMMSRQ